MELKSDLDALWHLADLNKDGDIDWDDLADSASKYGLPDPTRADGDPDDNRDVQ